MFVEYNSESWQKKETALRKHSWIKLPVLTKSGSEIFLHASVHLIISAVNGFHALGMMKAE